MSITDLTEPRFNGGSLAASSLEMPAEFWAPPLAPCITPADRDSHFLEADTEYAISEQHPFGALDQADLAETGTRFAPHRALIAGSALVAATAATALACFFMASPGEKPPAQVAPPAQSSPVAAGETPGRIPEPAPVPTTAVAWPDLPPSAAGQVAAAPAGNVATRQAVPAPQNQDIVFLQRPGVNIRATPAANGSILGTGAKGTRFKVTKREGDWVQVENSRMKGWISSQFLASKQPQ